MTFQLDNRVAESNQGDPDLGQAFDSWVPALSQRNGYTQPMNEQAWHRAACYLKAAGMSVKEIATQLGKAEQSVRIVLNTPRGLQIIAELTHSTGIGAVQHMIDGEMTSCIFALAGVRDDPEAPASARVAASNSLLDRSSLGKPKTMVEVSHSKPPTVEESLALDQEREELTRLLEAATR